MNRRDTLLALLALGSATGSPAAFAQQPGKVWRVGRMTHGPRPESPATHFTGAFALGMRELGYVEGKNLKTEERYADGDLARSQTQAIELVKLNVDVIVTGRTPSTKAAQKATSTTPIVFPVDTDPVANGLVASLARPGGNITGLAALGSEISAKHLEMLRSVVPRLSRVAVLVNHEEGPVLARMLKNLRAASQGTGATIESYDVRNARDIDSAFEQMVRWRAGALIVLRGPFMNFHSQLVADLAAKNRLPAIAGLREFVDAGGLLSYGPSLAGMFRRGATYVDKIFKGAKPGDLPVQQPTIFELFINGKTARALGLKIPQALLISVDRVIE